VSAGISLGSAIIAIGVLAFGLVQYHSAENWKRGEFVAAQVKESHRDKINEAVSLMLDYDPAHIELFPDRKEVEDKYVYMWILKHLQTRLIRKRILQRLDLKSGNSLSTLSNLYLGFNYYVSFGAIDPKELCQELDYPAAILRGSADVRKLKLGNSGIDIEPFATKVHNYLNRWQNTYVGEFLEKIYRACS
jgi:hypothetical protein